MRAWYQWDFRSRVSLRYIHTHILYTYIHTYSHSSEQNGGTGRRRAFRKESIAFHRLFRFTDPCWNSERRSAYVYIRSRGDVIASAPPSGWPTPFSPREAGLAALIRVPRVIPWSPCDRHGTFALFLRQAGFSSFPSIFFFVFFYRFSSSLSLSLPPSWGEFACLGDMSEITRAVARCHEWWATITWRPGLFANFSFRVFLPPGREKDSPFLVDVEFLIVSINEPSSLSLLFSPVFLLTDFPHSRWRKKGISTLLNIKGANGNLVLWIK